MNRILISHYLSIYNMRMPLNSQSIFLRQPSVYININPFIFLSVYLCGLILSNIFRIVLTNAFVNGDLLCSNDTRYFTPNCLNPVTYLNSKDNLNYMLGIVLRLSFYRGWRIKIERLWIEIKWNEKNQWWTHRMHILLQQDSQFCLRGAICRNVLHR